MGTRFSDSTGKSGTVRENRNRKNRSFSTGTARKFSGWKASIFAVFVFPVQPGISRTVPVENRFFPVQPENMRAARAQFSTGPVEQENRVPIPAVDVLGWKIRD